MKLKGNFKIGFGLLYCTENVPIWNSYFYVTFGGINKKQKQNAPQEPTALHALNVLLKNNPPVSASEKSAKKERCL